jgi:adenosylmethionine-8-amino-7-oxononanoate aminotransferase
MFGGLTHEPAIELAERLIACAPAGLEHVFFSDSGSVSVEVAMKMARQYFIARGEPGRQRFLTVRRGYHGDTWGAMSVCDPERGMHALFAGSLEPHLFAPAPQSPFGAALAPGDIAPFEQLLTSHARELAAVIIEPVVQNAGGIRFYSAAYLSAVAELCERHGVLLIADEIATGFGRTGQMFACEHANVTPDIMCVGKALTGGMLSLAATLTRPAIAEVIARGAPGRFMHGPTYMGNALACSIALAVLEVLEVLDWRARVLAIEAQLQRELAPCAELPGVSRGACAGGSGRLAAALRQPAVCHAAFRDRRERAPPGHRRDVRRSRAAARRALSAVSSLVRAPPPSPLAAPSAG